LCFLAYRVMSFRDLGREFLEHLEAFLSVLLVLFFDVVTTAVVVYVLLEAAEIVKGLILEKDPRQYSDLLNWLPYFDEGVLAIALLLLAGRLMKGLILRLYRR
jgi:hypothetical protein